MADTSDLRTKANRLRTATESLTDTRDMQVVQDYLSELERLAAEQEAAAAAEHVAEDVEPVREPGSQFQNARLRALRR